MALLVAAAAALACSVDGGRVGDGTGPPQDLDGDVVLSHWVRGGIAGLAHEVRATTEDRLELYTLGSLTLELPLDAGETATLRDLVSRAGRISESSSDPPGTADGMGTGLSFAGRGESEVAGREVADFASRLLETAIAVADVGSRETVVIGAARRDEARRLWRLEVKEVLLDESGAGLERGAQLPLPDFGSRHAAPESRVWGLALVPAATGEPPRVAFWRHAPLELAPRVRNVLVSRAGEAASSPSSTVGD